MTRVFHTVLVANRGEVAVRVLRTLRRLGIRSVTVYSDADAGARHVHEADVAVHVGPAPARESYLCVPRLLDVAARTGAQSAPRLRLPRGKRSVRACLRRRGLVFVGPPAHAVVVMVYKLRAK